MKMFWIPWGRRSQENTYKGTFGSIVVMMNWYLWEGTSSCGVCIRVKSFALVGTMMMMMMMVLG
jgi:hypothetical protein